MYIQSIHITSLEKYLNTRRRIKVPSVEASCMGDRKNQLTMSPIKGLMKNMDIVIIKMVTKIVVSRILSNRWK